MDKFVKVEKSNKGNKIRVNITVDKEQLDKAKRKLEHFGGKISTLFNAYLNDFVESLDKQTGETHKEMQEKIENLEKRLKDLEGKSKKDRKSQST